MEVWKTIEGYDGKYQISNLLRIRNKKRSSNKNDGILKICNDERGYKIIGLYKNKKQVMEKVHRLIAFAFIPNPENKPQINHINGIRHDKRIENLEWSTQRENMLHAYRTKLQISLKGEKSHRAKLTDKEVLEIRLSNLNQYKLAEIYKVSQGLVSLILQRKNWKHI